MGAHDVPDAPEIVVLCEYVSFALLNLSGYAHLELGEQLHSGRHSRIFCEEQLSQGDLTIQDSQSYGASKI